MKDYIDFALLNRELANVIKENHCAVLVIITICISFFVIFKIFKIVNSNSLLAQNKKEGGEK
ncbi:hypothetical protein [Helicobacter pullorum]|uniref:hypothetical protein n=1 Tax=Helicobacter pullorum TaxID=35818 RepID=UPI000CF05EFE|nr:hypothetical protein [Helicobacter pullorum]